MISLVQVLRLHELSINRFGGSHGIRDSGTAIIRPYQMLGGETLYKTAIEKAAESLIMNHPFVDGNKRTGFLAMLATLKQNGYELTANEEEAYTFTINISTSSIDFWGIVRWLKENSASRE